MADYILAASELLEAPPLESLVGNLTGDAAAGANKRVAENLPADTILLEAENFARGNVLVDTTNYGAAIGVILNRAELPNFVEYDVDVPRAGTYQVELRYAAAEPRSVMLLVDGQLRKAAAAATATGSWHPNSQRWVPEGVFALPAGRIVVRLERSAGPFPHFDCLALVPRMIAPDAPRPLAAEELARERGLVLGFLQQWVTYLTEAQGHHVRLATVVCLPSTCRDRTRQILRRGGRRRGAAGRVPAHECYAVSHRLSIADRRGRQERDRSSVCSKAGRHGRSPAPVVTAKDGPLRVVDHVETHYATADRELLAKLQGEVADLEKSAPAELPHAMAVEEGTATDLQIHIRGSHLALGELSPEVFPEHSRAKSHRFPAPRADACNWPSG